ncbi:anhydro-N-acetylmuramic acid kinase [Flavimaribacter sediminis]
MEELTAIGLMSGTSMDGIDIAHLRSDGETIAERGPFLFAPYSPDFRKKLAASLDTAKSIEERSQRPGDLADIEKELTDLHANAVARFMNEYDLKADDIDLIGFHGQTVLHRPGAGMTVQLGDGQALASKTGVPVIYDMRAADMIAGGEGAPLAPAYHGALARGLGGEWPVAFVNIGGISNITCVAKDSGLVAFDTGPGNTLIDQWVEMKAGIPFDQGGAIASEGGVLRDLLDHYLKAEFFHAEKRRSLDRNDFLPPDPSAASLEDGARSLARLTAEAIFTSAAHLPEQPKQWIICGGGRQNIVIMNDLEELAEKTSASVFRAEDLGLNGDSMEAEAWAFLAIRSRKGLPLSWPETTGCREPVSGGILAEP